jgi:hypothetical protein
MIHIAAARACAATESGRHPLSLHKNNTSIRYKCMTKYVREAKRKKKMICVDIHRHTAAYIHTWT